MVCARKHQLYGVYIYALAGINCMAFIFVRSQASINPVKHAV